MTIGEVGRSSLFKIGVSPGCLGCQLKCVCTRNGGSVMSTGLWCSYMVESAVVLGEKGRQDALWGEGWGGVVGLGRYLGDSVPSAAVGDGVVSL